MEYGTAAGLGREKPELWIAQGVSSFQAAEQLSPITPIHVALIARTRADSSDLATASGP